jgi:hypothetical protein
VYPISCSFNYFSSEIVAEMANILSIRKRAQRPWNCRFHLTSLVVSLAKVDLKLLKFNKYQGQRLSLRRPTKTGDTSYVNLASKGLGIGVQ